MSQTSANRPMEARRVGKLLPTLVILIALVAVFMIFAKIWTQKLWFDQLGFTVVFVTRLTTIIGIAVVATLWLALMQIGNIWIALKVRPRGRRSPSLLLQRYLRLFTERFWVVVVAALVIAVALGSVYGVETADQFLMWRGAQEFGQVDPKFGKDIGFYMFVLPWWKVVLALIQTSLVLGTIVTAAAHFVAGGLAFPEPHMKNPSTKAAKSHLAILIGLLLVGYGVQQLLARYDYLVQPNQLLTGLTYTSDHASLNARIIMAVVLFLCAALFFVSPWLKTARIGVIAIILAVVSMLLVGLMYPALVQQFEVRPNEPDKERPYIKTNLAATRFAYGIQDTEIQGYSAKTTAQAGQLKQDAEALPGIRLMDPAVIPPAFEQLQQVRGYYSFAKEIDVDRYAIKDDKTDVVIAARELDETGIPDRNWNNIHTVYTHGYGLVAAYGNRRQGSGEPDWIMRDIPPVGLLDEHEARIYYGELAKNYVVVGREEGMEPIELDTPGGGKGNAETKFVYGGLGGVPIGNWFNRILYAAEFRDINLLLSDRVNAESKVLYQRTPRERVSAVAPWLVLDSNTYPAVVDGRVVWIVDGYTTSSNYPNSHQVMLNAAASDSTTNPNLLVDTPVNYIRNAVKAVVDAYDGTVKLYEWDESDPVLKAWKSVYPGTVKPRSEISDSLLKHLRYPEDLFKVQRSVMGRYHTTSPDVWYQQSDLWVVPNDPVHGDNKRLEPPYYLSLKWPGDSEAVFSQTAVFVPSRRQNLVAYVAVNADASSADYGQIRVLKMSDTQQIDGPSQTFNAMTTNEVVAERLRPFLAQGSAAATYGNLLTLPVGGGLLYVMPVYTERQGSNGAYPALRFVVVRFGEQVAIGDTLQQALDQVFKGDAGASTGESDEETKQGDKKPKPEETKKPADNPAAEAALERAEKAFVAADQALKAGDLATYQVKINEARAEMETAYRALGR